MPPAIDVRELVVRRDGSDVLRGVAARVGRGDVCGLLGPSGAGKTTLMRAIVGVQRITAGSVAVLGRPAGSPALRAQVGYVTQAPAVYPDLTARENLRYFARILGAGAGRPDAVLEEVGLTARASAPVRELSGGEQARVSLATALLNHPAVLVLDEPTVGLDPLLRIELWDRFHALAAAGAALLVSSHVMDEAARCDRVVLLREGEVVADDAPRALLERTGAASLEDAFVAIVRGAPEGAA
ncbi:MAG TPA: ABC transporter ATP-binding protein [Solirubrobacteraceae bacterium]|nr:ABC transporter ATP-binding protein [Solirubrobacteraceae bacterium]